MQKPGAVRMGARKTLSRSEAVEQYVILRMRVDELNRLDYLLKALKDKRITQFDWKNSSIIAPTIATRRVAVFGEHS